jgi:hypothetical protein
MLQPATTTTNQTSVAMALFDYYAIQDTAVPVPLTGAADNLELRRISVVILQLMMVYHPM